MATPPATGVRSSRAGAVAVLSAVAIWSVTNSFIKLSTQPALAFALYRLWLGAALLLAITLATGRRLTWPMVRASASGGALLCLEIAFFFSAMKHTSIADATMISALQPALVLLVAGRLFGERVTARDVGWTVVSLVGVALVAVGSSGTPVWSLRGDVFAACSLVAWTAYFLVSKRARASVPALEYMSIVMATAALLMTPLAVLSREPLGGVGVEDLVLLVVFVVGASAGHVLVAWAHAHVDVSISSLLMLAQPVLASVAALAILGEPLRPLMIVGGAIVVGALTAIVSHAARIGEGADIAASETPQL